MGNSKSTSTKLPDDLPGYTVIGRGLYGIAYRENATGHVMKRGRTAHKTMNVDDQFWRNVRFMDYVEGKGEFAKMFAHLVGYSVSESAWTPAIPPHLDDEQHRNVTAQYASPYEYRLTMTSIGRPLDLLPYETAPPPPALLYGILWQVLCIVRFLQQHKIVHADLHQGNFLVRGYDGALPLLGLIDYDDVFFESDRPYAALARNHHMLAQVSMMMANLPQTFACIAAHAPATKLIDDWPTARASIHAEDPAMAAREAELIRRAGVDADSDAVVAFNYDIVKARAPALHRRLCGLPETAAVHTWFPAADFDYLYAHIDDIDAIIAYVDARRH